MLNKKIALGLFAAFALVSPATANDGIQAGAIKQIGVSNANASYGSTSTSEVNQYADFTQVDPTVGHGIGVQGGTLEQLGVSNADAYYNSTSTSEVNQYADFTQVNPYLK